MIKRRTVTAKNPWYSGVESQDNNSAHVELLSDSHKIKLLNVPNHVLSQLAMNILDHLKKQKESIESQINRVKNR